MLKIKMIIIPVIMLISGTAIADVNITDTSYGAWVSVTHDGSPLQGAEVTVTNVPQQKQIYITNESGRVFVPLSIESSRSIKYQAKKNGEHEAEASYNFHSSHN